MINHTGTIPLCGHCGKPVIGQPTLMQYGIYFHVECCQSPYKVASETKFPTPKVPNHD